MSKSVQFFILGAPKCGTTALFEYMRAHPDVFLPEIKEPHYFCTDFPDYRRIVDASDYERQFAAASASALIGEASVFYLYSREAVPNILRYNANAKFIVMVRNPVDMAYSLHSQLCFSLREDKEDFLEAWQLQATRAAGTHLPANCLAPQHLQYGDVCSLGRQLQRLYDLVPPDRVKVLFFDDLVQSAEAVYMDVLSFLGLPPVSGMSFAPVNANKVHRSRRLSAFIMHPPPPLGWLKRGVARALGPHRHRVSRRLYRLLASRGRRMPLSPEIRAHLADYFSPDIELLGQLTSRDLSAWRAAKGAPLRNGHAASR